VDCLGAGGTDALDDCALARPSIGAAAAIATARIAATIFARCDDRLIETPPSAGSR
jgi:hypothetical protein